MRKMFSKKQLEELIALVVESKDWELAGDVSIGGDLVVTGSINGEENPSVKPLYFHPIRFTISGTSAGQQYRVVAGSIIIINNSDESLNTHVKLRDYLYNNGTKIDVLCSIDFYDGSGVYQGQILKITASSINIEISGTTDGTSLITGALGENEFVVIGDLVNKIN